ncbi:hypothetical protein HYQ44_017728 [Verticillium longisporum]|nr:hypothetical protein HYQ44_017728 [Verticillium longisporum]
MHHVPVDASRTRRCITYPMVSRQGEQCIPSFFSALHLPRKNGEPSGALRASQLETNPLPTAKCFEQQKMAYHTRPGKGSGPVFLRPSPEPSGSSSNSVCPVCKNWSLERWTTPSHGRRESPGAPMRVDFFQVAESAYEEQCRFCNVIYYSLLAMGCDVQISGYSVLSLHAKPKAPFYVLWDDARVGRSVVEVFREKDSKCLLNMLGSATPLREDLRDPRLYDEIRQLLNECEKKHPACSQVTASQKMRDILL